MTTDDPSDAGWRTWANLVTAIRLALLPLFVWLLFATPHRTIASWLLAFIGATDWIDGYLARRFNQTSNLGKILDPTADRLLVMVGILSIALAGGVPWWFAGATLVREVLLSTLTLVLAAMGAARIDVLFWGKVSTFILMVVFPLFLVTSEPHHRALSGLQHVLRDLTWVGGLVGLVMAWVVFVGYIKPAADALERGRQGRRLG